MKNYGQGTFIHICDDTREKKLLSEPQTETALFINSSPAIFAQLAEGSELCDSIAPKPFFATAFPPRLLISSRKRVIEWFMVANFDPLLF